MAHRIDDELDRYVQRFRVARQAGEPVRQPQRTLLCEPAGYMEGYLPADVSSYAARALKALGELGIGLTDEDRIAILETNFLSMSFEAYRTLVEALGATREVQQQAIEQVFEGVQVNPDIYFLDRELFDRINAARTKVGLEAVAADDDRVVLTICGGIAEHSPGERLELLRKTLGEYGWTVFQFAKLASANLEGDSMTPEDEENEPEVLAELYITLLREMRQIDRHRIETDLQREELYSSPLIGWAALRKVAELEREIYQGGYSLVLARKIEELLDFLALMETFEIVDIHRDEAIRRAVSGLLEDEYTREAMIAAFKEQGYSLYELAGVSPKESDGLDQIPEPTAEELERIETSQE